MAAGDVPIHISGWQAECHQTSPVRQVQRAWPVAAVPPLADEQSRALHQEGGELSGHNTVQALSTAGSGIAGPRESVLGFRATRGPQVSTCSTACAGHPPQLLGDMCRPVGATSLPSPTPTYPPPEVSAPCTQWEGSCFFPHPPPNTPHLEMVPNSAGHTAGSNKCGQ